MLDETEKEVVGKRVALVNKRVLTVNDYDIRVSFIEWRDEDVVFPELRARGPDIGDEATGITAMKITDRRCQHDNVARRLIIRENYLLHSAQSRSLEQQMAGK